MHELMSGHKKGIMAMGVEHISGFNLTTRQGMGIYEHLFPSSMLDVGGTTEMNDGSSSSSSSSNGTKNAAKVATIVA